jgi:hypothetical protein
VSAQGLAVQSGLIYRTCVTLTDGTTVWAGDVPASARGTVTISVGLPRGRTRLVAGVDLYREPPGIPMLTGRLQP